MRISDWSSDVCSSDLQRHPGRLLGGEENRPGGVLARGPAAVAGSCHRVDVGLGGVHRGVHVGELALHELELPDRLVALLALVEVVQGVGDRKNSLVGKRGSVRCGLGGGTIIKKTKKQ